LFAHFSSNTSKTQGAEEGFPIFLLFKFHVLVAHDRSLLRSFQRHQDVALLVDGSGHLGDGASRGFLTDHRDAVADVAIIGGSGAVTSAADRAIQEALGIG
jgi:hypothetical protein